MTGDLKSRALASLAAALLLGTAAFALAGPDDKTKPPAPAPSASASAAPAASSAAGPLFAPPSKYANLPLWKQNQLRETAYKEGQKLVGESKWKEALEKFQEANEIRSDPRLLLWMGFTEEQMARLLAARAIYTKAKEDAVAAGPKYKQEEQDAGAALTALAPKIPRLVFKLPKSPKSTVYIDTKLLKFDGDTVEVESGPHKILVSWPDDRPPFETDAEAKVGAATSVEVKLTPLRESPPQQESPPPLPPKQGGCGCRAVASDPPTSAATLAFTALSAALALRKRRRGAT